MPSGGAVKRPDDESESIHFVDAWRIPGVSAYAFCLFFSKLIAYTFLYWLPYYIKRYVCVGGEEAVCVRWRGGSGVKQLHAYLTRHTPASHLL